MTLLKFVGIWLASSIIFFALLFLAGATLPRFVEGAVHEPTKYERVDFSARKAAEDAAWASPRAGKAKAQGRAKETAEDPHVRGARLAAACHGQNCGHDVRGEARGFLPLAD